MKKFLFAMLFIFILEGCMIEPYKQAFKKDCGPYPENYMAIINDFLNSNLENPKSVQDMTVIKKPEKKVIEHFQESISMAEGHEVWECFIAFGAKNRKGKVIRDFHVVWIRNGRLVAFDYQKPELGFRFEHRLTPTPSTKEMPEPILNVHPE